MEQLTFGLSVALIGILVVFSGLVIIIGFIKIVGIFGADRKRKPVENPAEAVTAPAIPTPAPIVEEGVSPEIIAAITAAISAVMSQSEGGFVVRRVKRVSNASAWNRAGREDQIYSRM